MIGNGTRWAIADAPERVNTTETTSRLCFDVLVGAKDVGIGGDIVRGLIVFECPGILCAVDLLQICDAEVPRAPAASASELVHNCWGDREDTRQNHKAVNGCGSSRLFQSAQITAGTMPARRGR